jgi:hypothetical protein
MARLSTRSEPLILRWAGIGAVSAGLLGGLVGLILGLRVNPGTAWFAIFEIGVPASLLGGLVGFATGAIADAVGRINGASASNSRENL